MSQKCAIRLVHVDFYMSPPTPNLDVMYAEFRGGSVSQVPVIRIFGSTDTGKKICLHVHGHFPYLYIPYDDCEDAGSLKYQVAANIDKAVNISFGQASSNAQHVYKVVLVSGIPFYGFHEGEHQFLKIYLYNPALVRKVSNLLQSEVILGRLYQPHEAHIPYILQFMIDYNLHGMSKILLSDLKYRETSLKQSYCELEADTLCENILNNLETNFGTNPGIAALWEDERQRLRNQGQESLIGTCLTLSDSQKKPTTSHLVFKNTLIERLSILDASTETIDKNVSVYPSETRSNDLPNASLNETHFSQNLDETLDLNATFDEEAQDLYEILQGLGQMKNDVEDNEDSVLSQVVKNDEEEDLFDLSLSMAETTPFKEIFGSLKRDDLDETLVAQLDGQVDGSDSSSQSRKSSVKKRKSKYGALPIIQSNSTQLVTSQDVNVENAKRKLDFANSTICEVQTECEYKSKKSYKRKRRIKVESKEITSSNENNIEHHSSGGLEPNIEETRAKMTASELYDSKTNYRAKEGCSTVLTQDSDILSTSQKVDFAIEQTVSELYDSKTNYRAKEGCSTVFTQDSNSLSTSLKANYTQTESEFCGSKNGDQELLSSVQKTDFTVITPRIKPPTKLEVLESLEKLKIPRNRFPTPFYSNPKDVSGSTEVGHRVLKIPSKSVRHLEDSKTIYNGIEECRKQMLPDDMKYSYTNIQKMKMRYSTGTTMLLKPVKEPPSRKQVNDWLRQKDKPKSVAIRLKKEKIVIVDSQDDSDDLELSLTQSSDDDDVKLKNNSCEITGVTLNNTYGFKVSQENYQEAKARQESQHLTIFSLEVHIQTRGDLKPDPEYDPIQAIFYSIFTDSDENRVSGGIASGTNPQLECVETEEEIFTQLIQLIKKFDPEILLGYEIEMLSWGYLLERSQFLKIDFGSEISRLKVKERRGQVDEGLKIPGRILLDVWRLLRHEIALQSYSFENIVYHLLHQRVSRFSFKDLTNWWKSQLFRHRTISYYLFRVETILTIMDHLDLIGRTSELARLFGIQFFEVLSRGSQFRVESMMLRLAKPANYVPVSPSVQQRAKMKAPEYLPLILEPESKLYVDPVIVLDFQSLYPSMIIAYNYCFSTCLGKISQLGRNTPFEFGATQLKVSRRRLKKLLDGDNLNFSPSGVAFVKKQVRDGILPRMLREILETRLMVKNSMKRNKSDKVLKKILHNRQLGLKLIANVTYGYTAANFSGRMPAVELADSVVGKGRETLQRAIETVEKNKEWGARVVYGDTDSLFVLVEGRSRAEAFEIGKEIADAVTEDNPDPVKLKLEKVYQPCILQTKKRYVGYMYESPEQSEPVYEAKGIETVRRDGCPAVAKMLEKCLRLLFETMDVSLVKSYVLRQFDKIMTGRVSLQDLTFAKEYRGAANYRPGACVPALELARKWLAIDRRAEPRRKERVPYVIVSGPPGVPLIRLVRSPFEFLADASLRPNAVYYVTKVIIPPINRCFSLIGADVNVWFNQMPRKQFQYLRNTSPVKKSTISQYFASTSCPVCGAQTHNQLCDSCVKHKQNSFVVLNEKVRLWEQASQDINLICQTCTGLFNEQACISLDCPILYKRVQTSRDSEQTSYVREVLTSLNCQDFF